MRACLNPFRKRAGQHLFVKALCGRPPGRQNQRLSSSVAIPDLRDNAFKTLSAEFPAAARTVLGPQLAVEEPEKNGRSPSEWPRSIGCWHG